jgi:DNA-binding protein YbaB
MKDIAGLMKQAQAMQGKLAAAQKELETLIVLGQAGDGLVKVTLTGAGACTRWSAKAARMSAEAGPLKVTATFTIDGAPAVAVGGTIIPHGVIQLPPETR